MLNKTEKRFVKTPSSFNPRKKVYTKGQIEKRITDTAEDIGLLIENEYNISEIVESIIHHSGNRVTYLMEQISKAQKIIDGLETGEATTVTESKHIPKKLDDSKKSDDDDDSKDEDWDM